MKRSLGVSLYPDHSDLDEDKEYIKLAQKYGFTRIFMSMLEVTEDPEIVKEKFRQLITCLLYTSPSPRDGLLSRMPSSA